MVLDKQVAQQLAQGYSEQTIRRNLKNMGYSESEINEAISAVGSNPITLGTSTGANTSKIILIIVIVIIGVHLLPFFILPLVLSVATKQPAFLLMYLFVAPFVLVLWLLINKVRKM